MNAISRGMLCLAALSCAGCLTSSPETLSFNSLERPVPSDAPPASRAAPGHVRESTPADPEFPCAPEQGFALGAAGAGDDGLCEGPDQRAFAAAYQSGRSLFLSRLEVEQIKAALIAAQRDLWSLKNKRLIANSGLLSASTSVEERRRIKAATQALDTEKAKLDASITAMRAALVEAEADVSAKKLALTGAANAAQERAEDPLQASF